MPSAAASDCHELQGLTVARLTWRCTIRLANVEWLKNVLSRLSDGEKELSELHEIAAITGPVKGVVFGAPNRHFVDGCFINAKPRERSRFSGQDRGAWYAALEVATCFAEVAFHLRDFMVKANMPSVESTYTELIASMAGKYVDLCKNPGHPSLNSDPVKGYAAGGALAAAAIAGGALGIVYPSVRRKGGTCIAALFPSAVQSVEVGKSYRLFLANGKKPRIKQFP
jgi:hypothetical protein